MEPKSLLKFADNLLQDEQMKNVKGGMAAYVDLCTINKWAMNVCIDNWDYDCFGKLHSWFLTSECPA